MTHSFLLEEKSIPVPRELAVAIGLEEAMVLQQLYYCLMNTKMAGTNRDGIKWIRNPMKCQDAGKQQNAEKHGKDIDWLSNFPFLKPYKIRQVFANLETLGLVVSAKLRAAKWDMCKYYSINWNNLTELLKSLSLPICHIPPNGFSENKDIHLSAARKSYQNINSTLVLQELERCTDKKFKKEKKTAHTGNGLQEEKKPELIEKDKDYPSDEFSATAALGCSPADVMPPESPEVPESDEIERFQKELEDLGRRLKKKTPAAWAYKIVENWLTNKRPCTYWNEFKSGIPLGTTDQREWEKEPGVPWDIAYQCVYQDFLSRPGTTPTEAARKAAQVFARPEEVASIWEAIKSRVMFLRDEWKKQEKLGVMTPALDPWMVVKSSVSESEAAIAMRELQAASPIGLASQELQAALPPAESQETPPVSEGEDAAEAAAKGKASILAALSRHKPLARRRQQGRAVEKLPAASKPPETEEEPILW